MQSPLLTFMLRLGDQFPNHCLNDSNIAIQKPAYCSPQQSNPDVGGKPNHDHAKHGSQASQEEDWLSAYAIRQSTPIHAHKGLGEREGRNEEAGVEGGIFFVSNFESLDESPGIGENRCQGNRLRETNDAYGHGC
jgi:hypothetical protein